MKNSFTLSIFLLIHSVCLLAQDTLYFESFENDLGEIIVYDLDSLVANSQAASPGQWIIGSGFFANAAISTSWYDPYGQSDDWLVLPKVSINDSSTISWTAKSFTPDFRDSYQILVSTTDSLPSSFTHEIFFVEEESPFDTLRTLPLNEFIGESIFVAFRNISNNRDLLILNDVLIESIIPVFSSADTFDRTEVVVFPNPSSHYVNIEVDGQASLHVYDASGRLIMENQILNHYRLINEDNWKGMYYLIIETAYGNTFHDKVIFH